LEKKKVHEERVLEVELYLCNFFMHRGMGPVATVVYKCNATLIMIVGLFRMYIGKGKGYRLDDFFTAQCCFVLRCAFSPTAVHTIHVPLMLVAHLFTIE